MWTYQPNSLTGCSNSSFRSSSQQLTTYYAPTDANDANNQALVLVHRAEAVIGASDSVAIALAATNANSPQDAVMLLAAATAKARLENNAHEFRTALVEEAVGNSDHTFEKRWNNAKEQADIDERRVSENIQALHSRVFNVEEPLKRTEEKMEQMDSRLSRLEELVKQMAVSIVTLQGGGADEVRLLLPFSICAHF